MARGWDAASPSRRRPGSPPWTLRGREAKATPPPDDLPMTDRLSLPKDRIHVMLLEGVSDSAAEILGQAGYTNLVRTARALDPEALKEQIRGVHILGIRSRTQLTEEIFAAAASPSARTRSTSRLRPGAASRSSTRRSPTPAAWPSS